MVPLLLKDVPRRVQGTEIAVWPKEPHVLTVSGAVEKSTRMSVTQNRIVNIHRKSLPAVLSGSVDVKSRVDTKEGDELLHLSNSKRQNEWAFFFHLMTFLQLLVDYCNISVCSYYILTIFLQYEVKNISHLWVSCSGLTGGEKCKQHSRTLSAFCLHLVADYGPVPDSHWIKHQQQNRNHMSVSGHLTLINCCSKCVKMSLTTQNGNGKFIAVSKGGIGYSEKVWE